MYLSKCEIGDQGFKTIIEGLHDIKASQRLQLHLAKNLLTNESIRYTNERYLGEAKEPAGRAYSQLSSADPSEINTLVKLRLKVLNLSNNFLRTNSKINFSSIFLVGGGRRGRDQGDVFHPQLDPALLQCPLKKFFSFLNTRIFIETLDLSNNFELGEDLAQFILKFLQKYELQLDP